MSPDTILTLKLTAAQANVVLAALGEAPYRVSAPLISAIMDQISVGEPSPAAVAAQPT